MRHTLETFVEKIIFFGNLRILKVTLNVSKKKEIDFRLLKEIPLPVVINEQTVEIVHKSLSLYVL